MAAHSIVYQTGLLTLLLLASACAPYPYTESAPIYDVNRHQGNQPPEEGSPPPVREFENLSPEVVPEKIKAKPAEKAVGNLLETAWNHYRNNDFDVAIAVAERAQRLDARSAEVYLVLARSYLSQGKKYIAEQFAQRGLNYSIAGSTVNKKLVQLATELRL
jgi:hypothetical protein